MKKNIHLSKFALRISSKTISTEYYRQQRKSNSKKLFIYNCAISLFQLLMLLYNLFQPEIDYVTSFTYLGVFSYAIISLLVEKKIQLLVQLIPLLFNIGVSIQAARMYAVLYDDCTAYYKSVKGSEQLISASFLFGVVSIAGSKFIDNLMLKLLNLVICFEILMQSSHTSVTVFYMLIRIFEGLWLYLYFSEEKCNRLNFIEYYTRKQELKEWKVILKDKMPS